MKIFTVHKRLVILMQSFAVVLILLLVIKPDFSFNIERRKKKKLCVLIDKSLSMQIEDFSGKSRLNRVQDILSKNSYLKNYNPDFFFLGKNIEKITPEDIVSFSANGDNSTSILKNIIHIQKTFGHDYSGILLFSDGQETGKISDIDSDGIILPVYTIGMGKELQDISLQEVISNSPLYTGDTLMVSIFAKHQGYRGEKVRVVLKKEGKTEQEKTVTLKGNSMRVSFELPQPETGNFCYEAKIIPLEGEQIKENNTKTFFVRVISPKINILYTEAYLRWEYKFLKRFLEDNLHFDTVFIIKVGENLYQQSGSTEKNLFETSGFIDKYDILILGDIDFSDFSPDRMKNIVSFLSAGKSILFLGGSNFLKGIKNTVMEEILPIQIRRDENRVIEEDFQPVLTPIGRNLPLFQNISGFPTLSRINYAKNAAQNSSVLLKKESQPQLILMADKTTGKGKCMILATDSTWKWHLHSQKEKTFYGLFWSRIMRHLCGPDDYIKTVAKLPEIITDEEIYGIGEKINIIVNCNDETNKTEVLVEFSGAKKILKTEQNKSYFIPEKEGVYFIKAGRGTRENLKGIIVKKEGKEYARCYLNSEYLRKLARNTGGIYTDEENAGKLSRFLKPATRKVTINISVNKTTEKFIIPVIFLLLCFCWWYQRREK
jgi:uncharacterized membrane protein